MTARYWVLEGTQPEPVELLEWADWMETSPDRVVNKDTIRGYTVSTVFLGINHNWNDDEPPLLFETMVFGNGPLDQKRGYRCSTHEEALEQHERVKKLVMLGVDAD